MRIMILPVALKQPRLGSEAIVTVRWYRDRLLWNRVRRRILRVLFDGNCFTLRHPKQARLARMSRPHGLRTPGFGPRLLRNEYSWKQHRRRDFG